MDEARDSRSARPFLWASSSAFALLDSIARRCFCDSSSTDSDALRASSRCMINALASLTVASSERKASSSRCLSPLDETLLLIPSDIEIPGVRLALGRLLGADSREERVRVADAVHGGVGVATLQLLDADRGVAVIVCAHLELGLRTRRVLEDFRDRGSAGEVHGRSVL